MPNIKRGVLKPSTGVTSLHVGSSEHDGTADCV